MESKRFYKFVAVDGNHTSEGEFRLSELFKDEDDTAEVIYALNDVLDDVLELEIEDTMYFKPNRDNPKSKGILTRIQ